MVRKMSGKKGRLTETDLRYVMRTISQRFIVGLTDEMEESVRRFNIVMGIREESHMHHRRCMDYFFGGTRGVRKENSNSHPTVSTYLRSMTSHPSDLQLTNHNI